MRPDFKVPIGDAHEAQWLLDEWEDRFRQTQDYGFRELADLMRVYIETWFTDNDDEDW